MADESSSPHPSLVMSNASSSSITTEPHSLIPTIPSSSATSSSSVSISSTNIQDIQNTISSKYHHLHPRRAEQIALHSKLMEKKRIDKGLCNRCLLLERFCICNRFLHLPYFSQLSYTYNNKQGNDSTTTMNNISSTSIPSSSSPVYEPRKYPPSPFSRPSSFYDIQISILLHTHEENRSSSTHKILLESFPFTRIYMPDSTKDGTMVNIWNTLEKESKRIYRYYHKSTNTYYEDEYYQTLVVLWPSEDKSKSVVEILQEIDMKNKENLSSSTLSYTFPSEEIELIKNKEGISSLSSSTVGSTSSTTEHSIQYHQRKIYRGLHIVAIDGTWTNARHISRSLPSNCNLITINNPYLITLFQPLRRQPAPGRVSTAEAIACVFDDWERYYNPIPTQSNNDVSSSSTLTTNTASTTINNPKSIFQNPHIYDEVLPLCPNYISRLIRYNLCILVDGLTRQTGYIGTLYGTGYRTWPIGNNKELFGNFSLLPTWLLERISIYAYGYNQVSPTGYDILRFGRSDGWKNLLKDYTTTPSSATSASSVPTTVNMPPLEDISNTTTSSEFPSSSSSPLLNTNLSTTKDLIRDNTSKRCLRLKNNKLPPANRYTCTPLSHLNHYFYCWAAGAYKLEKKEKIILPKPESIIPEISDHKHEETNE